MAASSELPPYCTSAIKHSTKINRAENGPRRKAARSPNKASTATKVIKVEQAIIAELKAMVMGLMLIAFRLKRSDEKSASAAASSTAASPP
jgi:hypothetical protein